jgi:hypothetical protein
LATGITAEIVGVPIIPVATIALAVIDVDAGRDIDVLVEL